MVLLQQFIIQQILLECDTRPFLNRVFNHIHSRQNPHHAASTAEHHQVAQPQRGEQVMRFAHGAVLVHRIGPAIHNGRHSYPVSLVSGVDPSDKDRSTMICSNDWHDGFLLDVRRTSRRSSRKFTLGERWNWQIIVDNNVQFYFFVDSHSISYRVPPCIDIIVIIVFFLLVGRNLCVIHVFVPVILDICKSSVT